jgi:phosphoribosyl 1,2-cyclic phosphodiesterase
MGGFASLGSGSRGNGTLVSIGDAVFLIDCGFNRKQAEQRLARLQMSPGDISAILVSHEHSDHITGVANLSHRYAIPVFASHGTLKNSPQDFQCSTFDGDAPFEIKGVLINPVRVPHDAREPTQFVLSHDEIKIGILSDLGRITPHVVKQFKGCTHLLLEANHDRNMLFSGAYPPALKKRVSGDQGHLSNAQARELLKLLAHKDLHVVIGHVSAQNNARDLVDEIFSEFEGQLASLVIATQSEGFDWIGKKPLTRQISFDKVM